MRRRLAAVAALTLLAGAAATSLAYAGSASSAPVSSSATQGTARLVAAASTTVSYSCTLPLLGTETFSGSSSGTVPPTVDAGATLTVSGYRATLVIPGSITSDMGAIGVPDPFVGQVTEEEVGVSGATPADVNVAATPIDVSVPYTGGDPATVDPASTSVGPFTAASSGDVVFSSGDFTVTGNFGADLGTQSITCTSPSPVDFATSTILSTISGLSVTTTSLPSATTGLSYSGTLHAVGGTLPYTWQLESGALPPGVTLDASTGVLSGIPTETGTYPCTFGVTDSSDPALSAVSAALSIKVSAGKPLPEVVQWGDNGEPQTTGTTQYKVPTAVTMPPGNRFTQVASGSDFSVGLTSTGAVYAWGDNQDGQLGDGTSTSGSAPTGSGPVAVELPAGVVVTAIAGGGFHALALTSTGAVYAWGANYYGQLGNGTTTTSDVPVPVSLPDGVEATAVAAGASFSLARTTRGTVESWGDNLAGELGDNSTTSSDVPVGVKLPAGVEASGIAAGASNGLLLASSGAVYAWGYGANGELGDGATRTRLHPVKVHLPTGTKATAISAEASDGLALVGGGSTLYAWGYGASGRLGDGATTTRLHPVKVHLPTGTKLTAIAGGQAHALALGQSGAVFAWGDDSSGQLGNDETSGFQSTPMRAHLGKGAKATAIGTGPLSNASFALTKATG